MYVNFHSDSRYTIIIYVLRIIHSDWDRHHNHHHHPPAQEMNLSYHSLAARENTEQGRAGAKLNQQGTLTKSGWLVVVEVRMSGRTTGVLVEKL